MAHWSSYLRLSRVVQMGRVDQMARWGHWHPDQLVRACCGREQDTRQAKKCCGKICSLVATCKKGWHAQRAESGPLLGDDFWEPLLPSCLTSSLGSWGFFPFLLCGDAERICSWRGGSLAPCHHFWGGRRRLENGISMTGAPCVSPPCPSHLLPRTWTCSFLPPHCSCLL